MNVRTMLSMMVSFLMVIALTTACGGSDDSDGSDGGSDGDEQVWLDSETNLSWQGNPSDERMPWADAKQYCEDLELGGANDWRMPTIGELRSLIKGCDEAAFGGECNVDVDDCLVNSCRNTACHGCEGYNGPNDGCYLRKDIIHDCDWFWSSTPVTGSTDVWIVYFDEAAIYPYRPGSNGHIICVQ